MDDCGCVLGHSLATGDSVPLCAGNQAADVHGMDGRDVPNRLGRLARFAGDRIFRVGDTRRPADATVRTRSDATPIDPTEGIALGKAKADQEC